MRNVLEINNLTVNIGDKRVIDNVSLELFPAKITAVVGESGSGKTMTSLAVLDLLPRTAVKTEGKVIFGGRDIFDLTEREKRDIRGNKIAMVFQEPFTSLNPVMLVGRQITEILSAHKNLSVKDIRDKLRKLLGMVSLSESTARSYPHELSGGMRQRVMLAMALSCDPEVLILDEPTTALDVSVQKEILDIIRDIQSRRKLATLFITHDFSIVNMIADDVYVMKDGSIIERGLKNDILRDPKEAYTRHLIDCIPKLGDARSRLPG